MIFQASAPHGRNLPPAPGERCPRPQRSARHGARLGRSTRAWGAAWAPGGRGEKCPGGLGVRKGEKKHGKTWREVSKTSNFPVVLELRTSSCSTFESYYRKQLWNLVMACPTWARQALWQSSMGNGTCGTCKPRQLLLFSSISIFNRLPASDLEWSFQVSSRSLSNFPFKQSNSCWDIENHP